MKRFITAIIILISLSGSSQSITLSRVYNPYNKNYTYSNANTILKKGLGYLIVGVGDDSTTYFKKNIQIYETDSIGNIIKFTSYGKDSCNYYAGSSGSLIKTYDGGYSLAGSVRSGNVLSHLIMRFNSNLDTVWTKTYISNAGINEDIIYQLCETYDKGFAFVGVRAITTTDWDVFLMKTDSLGNKLWENGISLGNYSSASKILETPDKGFLITGYRSYYNDGPEGPFVIKTDSMGNVLWYRLLGNPAKKNGGAASAITAQGDYLVVYGYSTYTNQTNEVWLARLNVIKYSPDGYQLWNRMYDTIRRNVSVHKIQVLPNNDFIVMGNLDQPTQGDNYSFFPSFLFKFNSIGDSMFRKIYFYSNNYVDESFLYDNVVNSDGSITACGLASSDTMLPHYKIWLIKTDSNGYAPGCYPTGVKEYYYTQSGEIKIFPNPATTQTTITYPIAEKAITLQIYNMLGQKVYEEKLPKGSSQCTIDTRAYKKGLYKVVAGESSGSLIIN